MLSSDPCPSRPVCPLPQHFTFPLSNSTHTCSSFMTNCWAVRLVPRLMIGKLSPMALESSQRISLVSLSLPRHPFVFTPQHFTVPLSSKTQEQSAPRATWTAYRLIPRLIAGALAASPEVSPISSGSPTFNLIAV